MAIFNSYVKLPEGRLPMFQRLCFGFISGKALVYHLRGRWLAPRYAVETQLKETSSAYNQHLA